MSATVRALMRFILILWLAAIGMGSATAQVTISPTSINFGSLNLGLTSSVETVTLTNTGTSTVTVTSLSISLPFHLKSGQYLVSTNIKAGASVSYNFIFEPTAAQTYNSMATFTVSGKTYSTTLEGTGVATTAVASISPTAINFGNVAVGSTSTENVTVTNTGTAAFNITAICSYPPFSIGGFTNTVTVDAGQSFTFQVSYFATSTTSITGTVTLTYNVLPSGGISLSGTGTTPSGLAVSTYPTLPDAIQGDSYLATFLGIGGKLKYHWKVSSGSLPSGLSLSTAGTISGTLSSSVAVGNYTFTVELQDSSKPALSATQSVTIPVAAPTGANCNDIEFDVPGTSTSIVALNDLGTGTYLGYEGGLYPGGSNVDPSAHLSAGESIAAGIQPLDGNGTVDPTNGVEVLLTIGVSYTDLAWFGSFEPEANADPAKNPKVVLVDGAEGGEDASQLVSTTSPYWTQIVNYWVPGAQCGTTNCTTNQVVAVWVNNVDSMPPSFPTDATNLESEYESIAQNIHTFFPNAVLAYFSSIGYSGYSNGVGTTDPEPGGYEGGFGVQLAIAAQINGDPNLNFNPAQGAVEAPWMAWGPYMWANGLLARSDGTTWACTDFVNDGIHPSTTGTGGPGLGGRPKIASFLLNFFKTDPTATPWFLTP